MADTICLECGWVPDSDWYARHTIAEINDDYLYCGWCGAVLMPDCTDDREALSGDTQKETRA